jgi:hypothetical protein
MALVMTAFLLIGGCSIDRSLVNQSESGRRCDRISRASMARPPLRPISSVQDNDGGGDIRRTPPIQEGTDSLASDNRGEIPPRRILPHEGLSQIARLETLPSYGILPPSYPEQGLITWEGRPLDGRPTDGKGLSTEIESIRRGVQTANLLNSRVFTPLGLRQVGELLSSLSITAEELLLPMDELRQLRGEVYLLRAGIQIRQDFTAIALYMEIKF